MAPDAWLSEKAGKTTVACCAAGPLGPAGYP